MELKKLLFNNSKTTLIQTVYLIQINQVISKTTLCETALFAIVNDLQVVIYNGNLTDVVMLDLSTAFDTVDHQRLLFKSVFLKVSHLAS